MTPSQDTSLTVTDGDVQMYGRQPTNPPTTTRGTLSSVTLRGHYPGIRWTSTSFRRPRWRSIIALATTVFLVVLVGHSALLHSANHRPHHTHSLLSSLGEEFTVNLDHAHLVNGSMTECHEVVTSAVVPRTTTTLAALGVVAAVVGITASSVRHVTPSGRGPPTAPTALAGQDLLTRLCLARR